MAAVAGYGSVNRVSMKGTEDHVLLAESTRNVTCQQPSPNSACHSKYVQLSYIKLKQNRISETYFGMQEMCYK